jgi:hypothetical protein
VPYKKNEQCTKTEEESTMTTAFCFSLCDSQAPAAAWNFLDLETLLVLSLETTILAGSAVPAGSFFALCPQTAVGALLVTPDIIIHCIIIIITIIIMIDLHSTVPPSLCIIISFI